MSFLWCSSVGKGKCHEHCAFEHTLPQTRIAWSEGIVQCRSGELRLRAKPCRQVWGAAAPGQILPLHLQPRHPGMCCGSSPAEAVLRTRGPYRWSLAAVLSSV